MVKFIKDYWFGILVSGMVLVCMLFAAIIAVAPHNDADMRGFTPCTYQMADELGQSTKPEFKQLFKVISAGYGCYLTVMKEGMTAYIDGKQKTPWSNYLFVPTVSDLEDTEVEAFSKELTDANMLNDDNSEAKSELFDDVQENDDEK